MVLNYETAHEFVSAQSKKGRDVSWDGWDIVLWKPSPYGESSSRGSLRNAWGIETRCSPNEQGYWLVPDRV